MKWRKIEKPYSGQMRKEESAMRTFLIAMVMIGLITVSVGCSKEEAAEHQSDELAQDSQPAQVASTKKADEWTPEERVTRFITAVREMDFQSIFELHHYWQSEVASIRRGNPRVLWEKLISEYYERERARFTKGVSTLEQLALRKLFMSYPAPDINELEGFLTPEAKVSVLEVKEGRLLLEDFEPAFWVYIKLRYPNAQASPQIPGEGFLKESFWQFVVRDKNRCISSFSRLQEGDSFWPADALHELLKSEEHERREIAARSLVGAGDPEAKKVLADLLTEQVQGAIRAKKTIDGSLIQELVALEGNEAAELLIEVMMTAPAEHNPYSFSDQRELNKQAVASLRKMGKTVVPLLEEVLSKPDHYRELWRHMGFQESHERWRFREVYELQKTILTSALSQDPYDAEVRFKLGFIYFREGEKWLKTDWIGSAVTSFEEALRFLPDLSKHPASAKVIANAYLKAAEKEYSDWRRGIVARPDDLEKAVRYFERALKFDPTIGSPGEEEQPGLKKIGEAYRELGYTHFKKDDLDAAIKMTEKAYQLNPDDPSCSYSLACYYSRKGDTEQGMKWLEIAYPLMNKQEKPKPSLYGSSPLLLDWAKEDPGLANLKATPQFKEKFPDLLQYVTTGSRVLKIKDQSGEKTIAEVPRGTVLEVLARERDSYKVRLPNGQTGWVSRWLVRKLPKGK